MNVLRRIGRPVWNYTTNILLILACLSPFIIFNHRWIIGYWHYKGQYNLTLKSNPLDIGEFLDTCYHTFREQRLWPRTQFDDQWYFYQRCEGAKDGRSALVGKKKAENFWTIIKQAVLAVIYFLGNVLSIIWQATRYFFVGIVWQKLTNIWQYISEAVERFFDRHSNTGLILAAIKRFFVETVGPGIVRCWEAFRNFFWNFPANLYHFWTVFRDLVVVYGKIVCKKLVAFWEYISHWPNVWAILIAIRDIFIDTIPRKSVEFGQAALKFVKELTLKDILEFLKLVGSYLLGAPVAAKILVVKFAQIVYEAIIIINPKSIWSIILAYTAIFLIFLFITGTGYAVLRVIRNPANRLPRSLRYLGYSFVALCLVITLLVFWISYNFIVGIDFAEKYERIRLWIEGVLIPFLAKALQHIGYFYAKIGVWIQQIVDFVIKHILVTPTWLISALYGLVGFALIIILVLCLACLYLIIFEPPIARRLFAFLGLQYSNDSLPIFKIYNVLIFVILLCLFSLSAVLPDVSKIEIPPWIPEAIKWLIETSFKFWNFVETINAPWLEFIRVQLQGITIFLVKIFFSVLDFLCGITFGISNTLWLLLICALVVSVRWACNRYAPQLVALVEVAADNARINVRWGYDRVENYVQVRWGRAAAPRVWNVLAIVGSIGWGILQVLAFPTDMVVRIPTASKFTFSWLAYLVLLAIFLSSAPFSLLAVVIYTVCEWFAPWLSFVGTKATQAGDFAYQSLVEVLSFLQFQALRGWVFIRRHYRWVLAIIFSSIALVLLYLLWCAYPTPTVDRNEGNKENVLKVTQMIISKESITQVTVEAGKIAQVGKAKQETKPDTKPEEKPEVTKKLKVTEKVAKKPEVTEKPEKSEITGKPEVTEKPKVDEKPKNAVSVFPSICSVYSRLMFTMKL
jgi:hypothetical protein